MTSKVLLDTNILLDRIQPDRPGHRSACDLFDLIGDGTVEGYVCAGSLKDIYYIARKHIDDALMRQIIQTIMNITTVLPVDRSVCQVALDSNEPDFEDGLIRAAAEIADLDFIITRDMAAFQRSPLRSLSAERYLEIFA